MKKIVLLAAMAALASVANAQVYVEGGVGFGSKTDKPKEGTSVKTNNFSVTPAIGYYLNDKFDIGLALEFAGGKNTDDSNPVVTTKTSAWGIAPFARYSFFQVGKFEVLAKLQAGFGGGNVEAQAAGSDLKVETSFTGFDVELKPVLVYNLTEKVVLTADLNFAQAAFTQTKVKDGLTTTNFGLGVDTYNVKNIGGGNGITIGFAYKF